MRKVITINIPKPCHKDWNKMTPTHQGRHCSACQKTVIDFTKQTDEQIIKTLESHGHLCGRFKTQQINRDLVIARKDKNNYRSWFASGLFAFFAFGTQEIYTQIASTDSILKPIVKGKVATSILNEHIYTGSVTTAIDGLPLPGATVILKRTKHQVYTNFDGIFSLKAKPGDTLEFKYFGMFTQNLILSTKNNITIALKDDECNKNYVIAGYVSYNYKSNTKCKRLKRKLKRLAKQEAIKNGEQKRTAVGKLFYGIKRLFIKK
ncbi:carboxypeptidase-like regulatory domain-containing protein [Winogradskyella sp.]|uniref:carboxypeptidase-like regulatory domain-containing protein n=1 Tax=Winogradskyella sp. TaxID=1883156 RepID=UPI003AB1B4A2